MSMHTRSQTVETRHLAVTIHEWADGWWEVDLVITNNGVGHRASCVPLCSGKTRVGQREVQMIKSAAEWAIEYITYFDGLPDPF